MQRKLAKRFRFPFGLTVALFILAAYGSFAAAQQYAHTSKRVRVEDINTLTLKHGHYTAGRRTSPVPQTKCIGGSAKGRYTPSVIQCYNRGSDGFETQWECKADLDNAYRFGHTTVVCEGFDHPNDPYVLAGSCGVEYTLEFTKEGQQQEHHRRHNNHNHGTIEYTNFDNGGPSAIFAAVFAAFIAYVLSGGSFVGASLIWMVLMALHSASALAASIGIIGGIFSIAYNLMWLCAIVSIFRSLFSFTFGGHSTYSTCNDHFQANTYYGENGGGFWSGLATGSIIGNLLRPPYNHYSYHTPSYGGWGSGWWGGGYGNNYGRGHTFGPRWSSTWSQPTRPARWSQPTSSGTRTASGFGGTRRR